MVMKNALIDVYPNYRRETTLTRISNAKKRTRLIEFFVEKGVIVNDFKLFQAFLSFDLSPKIRDKLIALFFMSANSDPKNPINMHTIFEESFISFLSGNFRKLNPQFIIGFMNKTKE